MSSLGSDLRAKALRNFKVMLNQREIRAVMYIIKTFMFMSLSGIYFNFCSGLLGTTVYEVVQDFLVVIPLTGYPWTLGNWEWGLCCVLHSNISFLPQFRFDVYINILSMDTYIHWFSHIVFFTTYGILQEPFVSCQKI